MTDEDRKRIFSEKFYHDVTVKKYFIINPTDYGIDDDTLVKWLTEMGVDFSGPLSPQYWGGRHMYRIDKITAKN